MYRLEREDFVRSRYLLLWSILAFQAGFINTFGFLSVGRSVSHVTGFAMKLGVELADNRFLIAIDLVAFPLFFVLGAFASALFTSARIERKKRPSYGKITLAMPIILLILVALGSGGAFGPFGEEFIYNRDFSLLFLLAFFCGVQNGCFATMTKGQVRTTHLTGISTDLGTDAARIWFGRLNPEEMNLTRRTQIARILTIACFAGGSVASALLSPNYGFRALLVPFVTSSLAFLAARKTSRILDERVVREKIRSALSPRPPECAQPEPDYSAPARATNPHVGSDSPPAASPSPAPEAR